MTKALFFSEIYLSQYVLLPVLLLLLFVLVPLCLISVRANEEKRAAYFKRRNLIYLS